MPEIICEGIVRDGVVVIEGAIPWPEGTRVRIGSAGPNNAENPQDDLGGLSDLLLSVAGKGVDLPPDLAAQHDHYLHGLPKR